MRHQTPLLLSLLALLPLLRSEALAQTVPDAGQLLQQTERDRPRPPAPEPDADLQKKRPDATLPPPAADAAAVTVTRFRFTGNTLLSEQQLSDALADYLNRRLDFAQLRSTTDLVAERYRADGWVVQTLLPRQDVTDGTVTIEIIEGRFGAVRLDAEPGLRFDPATAAQTIQQVQASGQTFNARHTDRAALLLDDLPGITASSSLTAGQRDSTTDLVLKLRNTALLVGNVELDNTGSRSTGQDRLSAAINLDSPLALGEQFGLSTITTEGSLYYRGSATLPIGQDGWRAGLNTTRLDYKLIADEYTALKAKGNATSWGLEASYPWLRTRSRNLGLSLNYDQRSFDNQALATTTSQYSLDVVNLGLNGSVFDAYGGGGFSTGSLTFTRGRVDLDGSPNQAADRATSNTQGNYQKLRLALSRNQNLTDTVNLYGALIMQRANRNLDGNERLSLGGANGVRAYPSSEASGSDGELANIELRWTPAGWPERFNFSAFYDIGQVRQNHDNNFAGAPAKNRLQLEGAGLAAAWLPAWGGQVKATWARRFGSNPNPTAQGNDQDGSLRENRFWLSVSVPFDYSPASAPVATPLPILAELQAPRTVPAPAVGETTKPPVLAAAAPAPLAPAPVPTPAPVTSGNALPVAPAAPLLAVTPALPAVEAVAAVKPSAPTVTPAAEVLQTLNQWLNAWRKGDITAYLGHYHPDFTPEGGVKKSRWIALRTQRLQAAGKITLTTDTPQITINGQQATVRFLQHYQADRYEDIVSKTLVLRHDGNAWRIVQEQQSAAR